MVPEMDFSEKTWVMFLDPLDCVVLDSILSRPIREILDKVTILAEKLRVDEKRRRDTYVTMDKL